NRTSADDQQDEQIMVVHKQKVISSMSADASVGYRGHRSSENIRTNTMLISKPVFLRFSAKHQLRLTPAWSKGPIGCSLFD
ncbi:MAG: hypothetical protein ACOCSK_02525, partial [Rhodothermales bacterium]